MVLGGVAIYLFGDLRGWGQGEMLRLCFRAALRIPAVQKGEERGGSSQQGSLCFCLCIRENVDEGWAFSAQDKKET